MTHPIDGYTSLFRLLDNFCTEIQAPLCGHWATADQINCGGRRWGSLILWSWTYSPGGCPPPQPAHARTQMGKTFVFSKNVCLHYCCFFTLLETKAQFRFPTAGVQLYQVLGRDLGALMFLFCPWTTHNCWHSNQSPDYNEMRIIFHIIHVHQPSMEWTA